MGLFSPRGTIGSSPGPRIHVGWFVDILVVVAFSVLCPVAAWSAAKPEVSLTLIPPSPVTDQIVLDMRGALRNNSDAPKTATVIFSLSTPASQATEELSRQELVVPPKGVAGAAFRWPTKDRAGQHEIIFRVVVDNTEQIATQPLEIIDSDIRSTQRIHGAWMDLVACFPERQGQYYVDDMRRMTDDQRREMVRAMHDVGFDIIVIQDSFFDPTHAHGKRDEPLADYPGLAYYDSKLYPGRAEMTSKDAIEAVMSEADKLGMHVFVGVGTYAWFDFSPKALAWSKAVATELYDLYGHHRSFYGWYQSHEKTGNLGSPAERRQLVDFFKEFTPHCRRMAPDKAVMLATNTVDVMAAKETYGELLEQVDIIAPFGFHRFAHGDETAAALQKYCDDAGAHLWMDMEIFEFGAGAALYPRSIRGLVDDLQRFDNFEKIICYQYPGMMNAPSMSIKPGGRLPDSADTVKLYTDYQRFLKEGSGAFLVKRQHRAVGAAVAYVRPYSAKYRAAGNGALTDGVLGSEDYVDRAWQGFDGDDIEVTIDLGETVAIETLEAHFLQFVAGGIFLPTVVEFTVSEDGRDFRPAATLEHEVSLREPGPLTKTIRASSLALRGRYVRVKAGNLRVCPDWHQARGAKSWLFVSEVLANPERLSSGKSE